MTISTCEICGHSELQRLRPGAPGPEVAVCVQCATVFNLSDVATASGVVSSPPDETILGFKGYKTNEFVGSAYDRILNGLLAPGRRVLDIGCFDGRFLAFARERGCEPWGLELQLKMAEFCRAQGLHVHAGRFPDDIPEKLIVQSFDLITAIECTCYWRQWDECMNVIRNWITPGGHLMIKLNQGTSRYYNGTVSWSERVGNFHAMLNVNALDILGRRHGLRRVAHQPLAYIFDRRRYHPSAPKRLLYRNWLRMKSAWSAMTWPAQTWDKIVVLLQKT
jgi:SAM-dependent methyltransferase